MEDPYNLYEIGKRVLPNQPDRAIKCFFKADAGIEDVVAEIEATKKLDTEIAERIFVALKKVGEYNNNLADSLEKSMPESMEYKNASSLFQYVQNVLKEYLYKNPADVKTYLSAGFEPDGLQEILAELKERCQTRAEKALENNSLDESQDIIAKIEALEAAEAWLRSGEK